MASSTTADRFDQNNRLWTVEYTYLEKGIKRKVKRIGGPIRDVWLQGMGTRVMM